MWKNNLVDAVFVLYDLQGKEMIRKMGISGNQLVLHRDKLDAGMYFFELKESENAEALTGKIMIQ